MFESIQPSTDLIKDDIYQHASLIHDVVHKLKNGLGGIGGFAALLDRDLDGEDPRKRLVGRIQDGVIKVNEIVVHLMTLVRLHEIKDEKIRLYPLIKDVWHNYTDEVGKADESNLFDDQHSDRRLEFVADSWIMEHLFYHTIRFSDLIGGSFERIRLCKADGEICFECTMNGLSDASVLDDPGSIMENCDSLEVRLSLAIMLKMLKYYDGDLALSSLPDGRHRLRIRIKEGR